LQVVVADSAFFWWYSSLIGSDRSERAINQEVNGAIVAPSNSDSLTVMLRMRPGEEMMAPAAI
jgi:hypothetical protein